MITAPSNRIYRAKVIVGVDSNGAPMYQWISASTKEELDTMCLQATAHYTPSNKLINKDDFKTYCATWYSGNIASMVSASTQVSYQQALSKYVLHMFGDRLLNDITAQELQTWMDSFSDQPDSAVLPFTIMRGVFRSAMADHIVTADPTAHLAMPMVEPTDAHNGLTKKETARLMPLMDDTRDGLFLAVIYYLGLRPSEATGLKWGDIDWENAIIHIQRDAIRGDADSGDVSETDATNRYVPIPDALYTLLWSGKGLAEAYVFQDSRTNRPISAYASYTLWVSIMLRAGLVEKYATPKKIPGIRGQYDALISPHNLRHNYIMMCLDAGLHPSVVQRIVGQRTISTVVSMYKQMTRENLSSTRDDSRPIFSPAVVDRITQKLRQ